MAGESFVDPKTVLNSVTESTYQIHLLQHIATIAIYRQYIGTDYKCIVLEYIGKISGLAALARQMNF